MPYPESETFFLGRWFAYLDVLGSLSGPKSPAPLNFSTYWPEGNSASEDEIDCLLGFTSRYIRILGNVASLVKECEPERLDGNGRVHSNWTPTLETERKARELLFALQDSRLRHSRPCPHRGPPAEDIEADYSQESQEVIATNDLYHWAGTIQVLRRTLNLSPDSNEVREAVTAVIARLEDIRAGSSAEACLLFPMFTAACEASNPVQRQKIMGRLEDVESFGLKQVRCPQSVKGSRR
jgi:hypothetical protein